MLGFVLSSSDTKWIRSINHPNEELWHSHGTKGNGAGLRFVPGLPYFEAGALPSYSVCVEWDSLSKRPARLDGVIQESFPHWCQGHQHSQKAESMSTAVRSLVSIDCEGSHFWK